MSGLIEVEVFMTGNKKIERGNRSCDKFEGLIQKRLNGEISASENKELDYHLADCDHCRNELVRFVSVGELLHETMRKPVEVPEDFFEKLALQLHDVKPASGLSALLYFPLFTNLKNSALAAASFILVMILSVGVLHGLISKDEIVSKSEQAVSNTQILIQTNNGRTILISGDNGDSDKYSAALDDLEKAFKEGLGAQSGDESKGFIRTSWGGKESASPIH